MLDICHGYVEVNSPRIFRSAFICFCLMFNDTYFLSAYLLNVYSQSLWMGNISVDGKNLVNHHVMLSHFLLYHNFWIISYFLALQKARDVLISPRPMLWDILVHKANTWKYPISALSCEIIIVGLWVETVAYPILVGTSHFGWLMGDMNTHYSIPPRLPSQTFSCNRSSVFANFGHSWFFVTG